MKRLLGVLCLFIPTVSLAAYLPGPIQVNTSAGVPTSVGWSAASSSAPVAQFGAWSVSPGTGTYPVSIQGTPQVQVNNSSFNVTGATVVITASGGGNINVSGSSVNVNNLMIGGAAIGPSNALPSFLVNIPTVTIAPISDLSPEFTASIDSFTLATTPYQISFLCGNSNGPIFVTGLRLTCTQTTAGVQLVAVESRTYPFVGAWSTITVRSDRTAYATQNSTAAYLTANPAGQGTLNSYVDAQYIGIMAPATAASNDIYIDPGWRLSPQVLTSRSDCLAVDLEGATVTGAKCSIRWKWKESYP